MYFITTVSMIFSVLLEDLIVLCCVETGRAVTPLGGGLRAYLCSPGGLLANIGGSLFGALMIYTLYVGIAFT